MKIFSRKYNFQPYAFCIMLGILVGQIVFGQDAGLISEAKAQSVQTFTREDQILIELAAQNLQTIRVEREYSAGYRREDWPHWSSTGCGDTRQLVLARSSSVSAVIQNCKVLSGKWYDPYTGEVFTDPKKLDIDHVVALQEAHASGGWQWSREKKEQYANYTKNTYHLMAVAAEANRAKSAYDPKEWLPPNKNYLCQYTSYWTMIKKEWGLSMDESERVAIGNILNSCLKIIQTGKSEPQETYGTSPKAPPANCIIKGNISANGEKIYHTPDSPSYQKTKISEDAGERWFCSERDAILAGWRRF